MEYGSVIFDMDGVVLKFDGGNDFKWKYDAVRDALRQLEVDPGEMSRLDLDAFMGDQGVEKCVEACEKQGIDPAETWEMIAEKTTRARVQMMKNGTFQLYPDAGNAIEVLREDEVELGLISNAPEMAVEATVNFYELKCHLEFFRGITSFRDLFSRKPHPDHLEFAKAELRRTPFLYVGDVESDIIAARDAGIDSVWVKRNGGAMDVKPDYEIESLDRLVGIVEEG